MAIGISAMDSTGCVLGLGDQDIPDTERSNRKKKKKIIKINLLKILTVYPNLEGFFCC